MLARLEGSVGVSINSIVAPAMLLPLSAKRDVRLVSELFGVRPNAITHRIIKAFLSWPLEPFHDEIHDAATRKPAP
ncbi:hypothetical protein JG687_00006003 [Phytophthora cactorum]|uniref:Uncharacterized protein n=1 Tax=Phytophthora cactorum TaxID=29920 RepID=A0A8T1UKP0_9STRA|nr:hypothetical protein GQ600_24687 [Phytophthora cactorum]KAG6964366.1 hypothetical protein JG687_00006003 [Phytophthora cactorum]